MFSAAVYQFVKSVGRDTLQPTASLDEAANIQLLNLVVKKRRRHWFQFWKHFQRVRPYGLTLNEVLVSQFSPPTVNKCQFTNYSAKTSFSLKGKFGAKLCDEVLSSDAEMSDSVCIHAQIGSVSKTEISLSSLMKTVNGRKLNLQNEFIKDVMKNSRYVLCIVTAMTQVDSDAKLTRKNELSESVDIGVKPIDVKADEQVIEGKELVITLPVGTCIAYGVCELQVSNDGTIKVRTTQEEPGGFDSVDGNTDLFDLPEEISNELKNIDANQFRKTILDIMSIPVVIENLLFVMDAVKFEDENVTWNEKFWKYINEDGRKYCQNLLDFVGLTLEVGKEVKHTAVKDDVLMACIYFLELLNTLSEDELAAIKVYAEDHMMDVMSILQVLKCSWTSKRTLKKLDYANVFRTPEWKLLDALSFKLDGESIQLPENNLVTVKTTGLILKGLQSLN